MSTNRLSTPIDYPQTYPAGLAGQFDTGVECDDVAAGGGQADIWTFTISDGSTFDVDDTIVVTFADDAYPDNVVTVTYTIVTGVTTEELVAAGFYAELMTSEARRWFDIGAVDDSGSDSTIAITARRIGSTYTVTVTDQGGSTVSVAHTQTGAYDADVSPGRVMVGVYDSGIPRYRGQTPVARMLRVADFTQMSLTWTVALLTAAGGRLCTRYRFAGKEGVVQTIMSTDNNTTVTAHVAALESRFNSEWTAGAGLVATDGTGAFTVKPDVAGAVFDAHSWVEGDADATCSVPTRVGSITDPRYSALAAFKGVSRWTQQTAPTSIGGSSGVISGGQTLEAVREGEGWVQNTQSGVTPDDVPYIDGSTNYGRIYNAASSGYLAFCYPDGSSPLRFLGLKNRGTTKIAVSRRAP